MDLRGNPKRDYDGHIRGGVGEATVRIHMDAEGGIGQINLNSE